MDDPFDTPFGRAMRQMEHQRRLWDGLGGVRAMLDEVERARNAASTVLGHHGGLSRYVEDLQLGRDRYKDILSTLGGVDGLRHALELASAQERQFDLVERGGLADAAAGATAMIASLSAANALKEARFAVLHQYARPETDSLASIGAAASHFQTLHDTTSFARLGFAIDAASGAFVADRLTDLDYRTILDPFFGDWTRIEKLPAAYGSDPGARREVLEEVDADEAFLHVSTEEVVALVEETSLDSEGVPITLMGEPVGIVLTQDPDDAAARIIRRVERALRARIVRVLAAKHGEGWLEALMPDRAEAWAQKRSDDRRHGLTTHGLIEYSDFADLATIIDKRWNDGFAGQFSKSSKVTSRIRALAPHRNYEFHSRAVTPEQLICILQAALELQAFLLEDEEPEYGSD
ncbi:Swt1 family HEPN domain-containing protein [Hyphomonas beringensis]|uniref:Swt1 family HEPN domain-containing protein n=1 Tax=Hyphomonas beringensis TaxID=1280946 RepID=UPI0012DD0AAD|nr:Swt1 family HEPN domain-containing protein [Hyphomonas beringensis]